MILSFVYRAGISDNSFRRCSFLLPVAGYYFHAYRSNNEGLGGSSTLRGVVRNRVIGDGFILGNVELRWKPVYFKFFNQDCYLGLTFL